MKIILREVRLKKRFSYRQLAEISHVSLGQIYKIESEYAKNPSIQTMYRLACALEVGLDELVVGPP